MTILTGEFTIDAQVSGQQAPTVPMTEPAISLETPEDAQLYLRHVQRGETIRAIARDSGCHASTVLRRIRRFEARRDDMLVDGALDHHADAGALTGREALNALRRLAEPGARMVVAPGMAKAIITRDGMRTAILDRRLAEAMALNGWVAQVGQGRMTSYAIAPAGREALRQRLVKPRPGAAMPRPDEFHNAQAVNPAPMDDAAETPDHGPEAAQPHRVWVEREIRDPADGRRRRARVNLAESPLLILARRRDGDGKPFLSAGMVGAGERLREDFELAQLGPRVTQNWDGFMTSGIDVSRGGTGYRGGSESARNRVAVALRDLGPGMGDIVLRVCCYLEGIEQTERRLCWSARSGKIVLRLALMRLERHYTETYGKGTPLIG